MTGRARAPTQVDPPPILITESNLSPRAPTQVAADMVGSLVVGVTDRAAPGRDVLGVFGGIA